MKWLYSIAFLLSICLTSCYDCGVGCIEGQYYFIEAGKQDFKPVDISLPKIPKEITYTVTFWESCYYNWLPDLDHYDWNKGGGWTQASTANNKNSALWVWRPADDELAMEWVGYTNDSEGNFQEVGSINRVEIGETFQVVITPHDTWFINGLDTGLEVPTLVRRIGLWVGGENNAEGPFGGEASQLMEVCIEFEF